MASATFRFYDTLNDFLPVSRRQTAFSLTFIHRMSIKDTIESIGVPHPEVGLLLVDGESVDFSYRVADGDMISVYPAFSRFEVAGVSRVLPPPLPEFRFVLDTHLGRLAGYLRMLGFDTLYRNDYDDPELAEVSARENRILLTRDRGLLMHGIVQYGYYVRYTQPQAQVREVIGRYGLAGLVRPFTRCLHCNGLLIPVAKEVVLEQLPPLVREAQETFFRCPDCGKVYWPGTHYERMRQFLDTVLRNP
ncbi:Mut7-C RNAse domain-containing protein [Larkinella soli]|uniref:Mut7-C RNAse domain-containing protein n=1 Tax=Larkinella soli TaxID=1770527 RepID=UPI000FFBDED7|nr:Mut7-C RNAse domain-containing protein [Larkinella soli]